MILKTLSRLLPTGLLEMSINAEDAALRDYDFNKFLLLFQLPFYTH